MIVSPCNQTCTLDRRDICIGCKRTRDEIMRWTTMNDAERRTIMRDLRHRS
jgi:uncharacterized protein